MRVLRPQAFAIACETAKQTNYLVISARDQPAAAAAASVVTGGGGSGRRRRTTRVPARASCCRPVSQPEHKNAGSARATQLCSGICGIPMYIN